MKLFNIDWTEFLRLLPAWHGLSTAARRAFLTLKPSGQARASTVGRSLRALVKAGMVTSARKKQVAVSKEFKPFSRAMRAMGRHRMHDGPDPVTFELYLADHFTTNELTAFEGGGAYTYFYNRQRLVEKVSSMDWVESFLAAKTSGEWEDEHRKHTRKLYFTRRGALAGTQRLLRALMKRREPVRFTELPSLAEGLSPRLLGMCLLAGIRYLLFFPALTTFGGAEGAKGNDLEPVIGVAPALAERLSRPPAKRPETVRPKEVFHSAFLMEDMTTFLVACSAEPVRLRQSDRAVFAKARKEMESNLLPLPDWFRESMEIGSAERLDRALAWLTSMDLVEVDEDDHGRPRLVRTGEGAGWLAGAAKDRLKALIDHARGSHVRRRRHHRTSGVEFLPWSLAFETTGAEPDLALEVAASFAAGFSGKDEQDEQDAPGSTELAEVRASSSGSSRAEADRFIPAADLIRYGRELANPFIVLRDKGESVSVARGWSWFEPTREESEAIWASVLSEFLLHRLVCLGGAKVALAADDRDERLAVAITSAGRCLLGETDEFDYGPEGAGEVIVQPNYEIVFLSPSPHTEAECARFAERKGSGLGVLFRITKESIYTAASAGLKPESVLDVLRGSSPKGIPANVEREVRGWFDRCRRVTVRPAVLIRCPDADTATRVIAAAGRKKVVPVTDTVLELVDARQKRALFKKLRSSGVFLGA